MSTRRSALSKQANPLRGPAAKSVQMALQKMLGGLKTYGKRLTGDSTLKPLEARGRLLQDLEQTLMQSRRPIADEVGPLRVLQRANNLADKSQTVLQRDLLSDKAQSAYRRWRDAIKNNDLQRLAFGGDDSTHFFLLNSSGNPGLRNLRDSLTSSAPRYSASTRKHISGGGISGDISKLMGQNSKAVQKELDAIRKTREYTGGAAAGTTLAGVGAGAYNNLTSEKQSAALPALSKQANPLRGPAAKSVQMALQKMLGGLKTYGKRLTGDSTLKPLRQRADLINDMQRDVAANLPNPENVAINQLRYDPSASRLNPSSVVANARRSRNIGHEAYEQLNTQSLDALNALLKERGAIQTTRDITRGTAFGALGGTVGGLGSKAYRNLTSEKQSAPLPPPSSRGETKKITMPESDDKEPDLDPEGVQMTEEDHNAHKKANFGAMLKTLATGAYKTPLTAGKTLSKILKKLPSAAASAKSVTKSPVSAAKSNLSAVADEVRHVGVPPQRLLVGPPKPPPTPTADELQKILRDQANRRAGMPSQRPPASTPYDPLIHGEKISKDVKEAAAALLATLQQPASK